MDQAEFLSLILGTEPGLLRLAKLAESGELTTTPVDYPLRAPLGADWTYFKPALYAPDDKEWAHGMTRAIASDLDEIERVPTTLAPSIVVNSSEYRVQAYWLTDLITEEDAWKLGRRLTPTADPSTFLRLPGSINTKYDKPYRVEVVRASLQTYPLSSLNQLPDPNGSALRELPETGWAPVDVGPKEFIKNISSDSSFYRLVYNASASFDDVLDSVLMLQIPDEQKVYIVTQAATNPFSATGRARESAKALMRRSLSNAIESTLTREIRSVRRGRKGTAFDRRDQLTKLALRDFMHVGTFLHTVEDEAWYVERSSGKAISLTPHSERLRNLIIHRLGINPVDQEHRHIIHEMIACAMDQPPIAELAELAWYDASANHLTVSLGGTRTLTIAGSGQTISYGSNGDNNLIFQLPPQFEPIPVEMIDLQTDLSGWWDDFFPGLPNLTGGMTEAQASALLYVWTVFFFFQNAAEARPLLAFLGGYGSGKSTFFRAIYRLIYGVQMKLLAIGTSGGFDTALSNHALALFDNVDTPEHWLNQKLAMAVSRIGSSKRKLYSDNDIYTVVNRAMVGVNSRTLPFMQEDIIDRMLHFNLLRLEDLGIPLIPERDIYSKLTRNRHRVMTGLIQDAQRVMRHPKPMTGGITWRMADFVDIGHWISSALGIEELFLSSIAQLKRGQVALTLEADQTLISALELYARDCPTASAWKNASLFWEDLLTYATADTESALRAKYKNSALFSRKLFAILGVVKKVVHIDYRYEETTDYKQWRIIPRPEDEP